MFRTRVIDNGGTAGTLTSAAADGQSDRAQIEGSGYFTDVTDRVGLDFSRVPEEVGRYFFPQIMGSGCAFLDFDRDGDLDIFLIDGALEGSGISPPTTPRPATSGHAPGNRLYRQEGDGRFLDVTRQSGLGVAGVGMGVAVGDVNNDGFPDLYVTNYGPDRLFLNQRDGTFVDITESAGIDNLLWGASCCFMDYDRDGWLDLFVTNYVDYHSSHRCIEANGKEDYCNPKVFSGTADKLYHNESRQFLPATPNGSAAETGAMGDRSQPPHKVRFRDVSLESRIALSRGPGLGVVTADFNGDRWPDLYVANDGAANFLWLNGQDGTFREQAIMRGAAYDVQGRPQAGMGIALGDVDGDGRPDLLVTHLAGETNALYHGLADGFEERSSSAGLAAPSFPMTGFGAVFADFDHDGDLDLAVVNGRVKRRAESSRNGSQPHKNTSVDELDRSAAEFWQRYAEHNQLFLNDGTGRFLELAATGEPFSMEAAVWRGLACGDVDNDGDIDLLATSTGGRARLFRNDSIQTGHWLQMRVTEPRFGGRDAYGAVVTVRGGGNSWVRFVNPAFSYLSSSDPRVHFGLGAIDRFESIEVIWPDGSPETFPGGPADRMIELRRGAGQPP